MDTRFWGPPGWKFLHTIVYLYDPINKSKMSSFLETLPYILPCKFCRASLTDYYRDHPYSNSLDSNYKLNKWLYTIHNCVNDKLRKQKLNPNIDPEFKEVMAMYKEWLKCNPHQYFTVFWDFLFSIAHNHPKQTTKGSTPMPECPDYVYECDDNCEKNKWNLLEEEKKLYWFSKFWYLLPAVLPKELQKQWKAAQKINPPNLSCRRSSLSWLWRMRCTIDAEYSDPYTSLCKKISSFSSDCSNNNKMNTCRKK